MLKQAVILSAVVLGATSLASAATKESRYVRRDLPQGGWRSVPQLAPVEHSRRAVEAPYALTGRSDEVRTVRSERQVPSHPRGTHNW